MYHGTHDYMNTRCKYEQIQEFGWISVYLIWHDVQEKRYVHTWEHIAVTAEAKLNWHTCIVYFSYFILIYLLSILMFLTLGRPVHHYMLSFIHSSSVSTLYWSGSWWTRRLSRGCPENTVWEFFRDGTSVCCRYVLSWYIFKFNNLDPISSIYLTIKIT